MPGEWPGTDNRPAPAGIDTLCGATLKLAQSASDTSLVEVRRRLALVPGQFATALCAAGTILLALSLLAGWVADDARIVDLHNSVFGHAGRDSEWIRLLIVLSASTLFGVYLALSCNRPHRLRWHIAALLASMAAFIYTVTEAEWAVSQSLLQNVEPGIGPTLAAWGAIGLAVGEVVAFAAFLVSRLRFEEPALAEAGGDGPSGQ
jgi:hypothetical protein